MPIETPQDLRDHVALAIQVELSTVPPYLYAMYSIEDHGSEAAMLLRSIVVEEMLHAALASNLLLAIGGTPDFTSTAYMPAYPADLPHHRPPLRIDLAPCSLEQIESVFMRIEQPETRGAPAQPDEFETLGQFYHALELGLEAVSRNYELFANPQREAQMSDPTFYQPVAFDAEDSGGLVGIEDLDSALEAIEIIVHQGEGMSDDKWADPDHQELTHYYKLLQIHDGQSPLGPVRDLPTNPRTGDYPPPVREVAELFNAVYRSLYLVMDRLFAAESNKRLAVGVLYILMADVMSQLATFLVKQTIGDGRYAAPTFEIFEFRSDDPLDEMIAMSASVANDFPELSTVHEVLRGLGFVI
ncbi:MAG: ferritin-like protein [Actinomycetota bacterium]|nr:ferritin-like protein [Actinomycetota bacterium]